MLKNIQHLCSSGKYKSKLLEIYCQLKKQMLPVPVDFKNDPGLLRRRGFRKWMINRCVIIPHNAGELWL